MLLMTDVLSPLFLRWITRRLKNAGKILYMFLHFSRQMGGKENLLIKSSAEESCLCSLSYLTALYLFVYQQL